MRRIQKRPLSRFRKAIGEELQKLREERQLSQKEVSARAGMRQTLVSKMEQGEALTLDNLQQLLQQAYCCTVGRFFAIMGE